MRTIRSPKRRTIIAGILAGAAAVAAVPLISGVALASLADSDVNLTVLSPMPGAVITTPTLPLHVTAKGYRIDARFAGTAVTASVGHYHEILDGHLVDMSPYKNGNFDTIPMVGVTPGPHVLTIVPARNDHSEVTSAAVNVPFTYAGPFLPEPAGYQGTGSPSITITAPANGTSVGDGWFTMAADVQNFVLCGDCFGKQNVAGEGHWHIFVDLPPMAMDPMSMMPHMLTMAGSNSQLVSLRGIAPGVHTFTAILVGNDHMPIMPMAMASVTLRVHADD
jgi:hypothetical protein